MPRKLSSRTIERRRQLLKAAEAAADDFLPPRHGLDEEGLLFWLEVFQAHDRSVWRKADRYIVYRYVRTLMQINRLDEEIEAEGEVIEAMSATGKAKVLKLNPKCNLLNALDMKALTYAQKLGLTTARRAADRKDSQDHPEKAVQRTGTAVAGRNLQSDDRGLLAKPGGAYH